MKCLVMVRVSTLSQETEDQHREMESFCRDEGYDEIVFVEDKGASAIKMNDTYRMMIDQVKESIESDSSIRCFAVWELSRAFRNELVFQEVKQFLVERGIQFLVKNPYLKLLNPDGSVNSGMEIAVTLMATLAKQEMELKKERFHRAKAAKWGQGKYIGGKVKFGYKVDDNGYIVPDEEDSKFVKMVFELYSTGRYSVRTLYDELVERGYKTTYHIINKMVADRAYIDSPYPSIISQELWDRCEKVRENNYLGIPKGRKYCFGSGIFKCSVCGRNMTAEGAQYRCWHHNKYSAPPHCKNELTIRVKNLDGLLWWIASKEEIKVRMKMTQETKEEYEDKIKVLKEKISSTQKKISYLDEKKRRIKELYIEGMIDKDEFKIRQNKILSDAKTYNDSILTYNERIGALLNLIEGNSDTDEELKRIVSVYDDVRCEKDLEIMDDIVKKHIKKVTATSEWFGKERDKRAVRQNAQLITIETTLGEVKKFIYVARRYKQHYFWLYKPDGSEIPLLSVGKIEREPLGKIHPRAFKKIKDW